MDDLHWGDPPSLAAVEYLGRRLEGLPVLLVVASRAREPGFDRSVLDALGLEPAAREVAPRALSEAGTAGPVRARLPTADDGFCRACHAATGGTRCWLPSWPARWPPRASPGCRERPDSMT